MLTVNKLIFRKEEKAALKFFKKLGRNSGRKSSQIRLLRLYYFTKDGTKGILLFFISNITLFWNCERIVWFWQYFLLHTNCGKNSMLGSRQFAIFLFVFMNKFSELHMHDFVQVKHCVHTKYLKVCTLK